MNSEEIIRQLQEELLQLQQQTKEQYQKINELQRRLQSLFPGQESLHFQPALKKEYHFSLENFIGLRLLHFIGIVVLVIGLSIGVKYAIDSNLVSEVMRIALAYAAGGILYFLSLQLKARFSMFSAILFSGGMASLYFTTYAAFVFYRMLPFGLAFGLMIALTFFTVYQAMKYNREEISILGLIGAYGIPFLISPNTGNPNLFFLYIFIINGGVVFLSIRKQWIRTGITAQVITWMLYLAWATTRMSPQWTISGLTFLMLFFGLFYFFALLQKKKGASFSLFSLYTILLNNLIFYSGCLLLIAFAKSYFSYASLTLAMSGFLLMQAALFHFHWKEERLSKRLMASGLILFVLFVFLNWEGITVTLLWLLTAVVVFTAGVVTKSGFLRIASMVLMAATLLKLVLYDSLSFTAVQKVLAYVLLGVLLLIVSFFYQKFKQTIFGEDEAV